MGDNRPVKVTFVCSGNICRSPSAEAVLRGMLAAQGRTGIEVDSFGIGPWHLDDGIDERAATALRARGYDEQHVARMIGGDDIAERDLVVASTRVHVAELRELAHDDADRAKIVLLRDYASEPVATDPDLPDPYYGGPEAFERMLDLIEDSVRGLIAGPLA